LQSAQSAHPAPPATPERTVLIPRVRGTPSDDEELRPRATPSLRPIPPHPTVAAPLAPTPLIPAPVPPDRWEKTVAIPRGGLVISELEPRGADDLQDLPTPAAPVRLEVWPPASGTVDLTVWPPRRGLSKMRVAWLTAALVAASIGWFYLHAPGTSGTPHPPQGIVTGTVTPVRPPPDAVEPGTIIQDCPTCPRMVVLPPGRFKQGSAYDDHDALPAEKPQHIVRIRKPLALAATELTVENFREFVADTNRELPGCETYDGEWHHKATASWKDPGFAQGEDHPVACVSWNDAVAYAKWLSVKTGHRYRLPSASEWEYAARSGSDAQVPWSPGLQAACENANVADRSAARRYPRWSVFACKDGYVNTAPTGSFKANAFGLHDMLGNVFEWTQDCWHDDYAKAPIDGSARMDGDCGEHELRGGSWFSSPAFVRLAYRNHYATGFRSSSIGIRLVRELTP
jgi:formylglycine-generating enzyme required for sulfatase activity